MKKLLIGTSVFLFDEQSAGSSRTPSTTWGAKLSSTQTGQWSLPITRQAMSQATTAGFILESTSTWSIREPWLGARRFSFTFQHV